MASRVVITGLGVVSPIGIGTSEFWKAALTGSFRSDGHPLAGMVSHVWLSFPSCRPGPKLRTGTIYVGHPGESCRSLRTIRPRLG